MNRVLKYELYIQKRNHVNGGDVTSAFTPVKTYNKLNAKSLITYSEFKDYLSSQDAMTNKLFIPKKIVEINSALHLLKKRNTHYKPPSSDTQFASVYHSNVINRNRLMEMLSFFIGEMWAKIAMAMAEHNKSDTDILNMIKQHYKYSDTLHEKVYRMTTICDTIAHNHKVKTLLDIGVGNGLKTKQMKTLLNCDVYGADIDKWGKYGEKRQFPFKQIQLKPYHIPYKDHMFDCITLILVLHHVHDVLECINECKRLLKKDGIVVIVEHDIWSDELNMLVDMQHRIYGAVFNESNTYDDHYYNHYEWNILFHKCGFMAVDVVPLTDDASNTQRYDAQYVGVYKINE